MQWDDGYNRTKQLKNFSILKKLLIREVASLYRNRALKTCCLIKVLITKYFEVVNFENFNYFSGVKRVMFCCL